MDELKDLDKKKSLERFKKTYSYPIDLKEVRSNLDSENPMNVFKFDPTLDSQEPLYDEFGPLTPINRETHSAPSKNSKISDKVFLNAVKNLSFDEQKTIIDLFLGKKK